VFEELQRANVTSFGKHVHSIAAHYVAAYATEAQKARWLPRMASGEWIGAIAMSEPAAGSDLQGIRTRAVRDGDRYLVNGSKTFISNGHMADLVCLVVKTDPTAGAKGTSLLMVETPDLAGYRRGRILDKIGMKGQDTAELFFDDVRVPAENLLGGVEGQGFKQLMQTFEAARIQTAARAIGVAQSALDLGLLYGMERIQFGKPIIEFPRVSDKLAMMAAEILLARQLTYFAAREKDAGRRCDLEAGMAKLLAARAAWAAADNALQIHGGNGFALEYPVSRVLCDARILSIFEGAAEIQAHVIARRLLEG
jgi:(2S)-methylsuccinyl-CoA dehydrogenase